MASGPRKDLSRRAALGLGAGALQMLQACVQAPPPAAPTAAPQAPAAAAPTSAPAAPAATSAPAAPATQVIATAAPAAQSKPSNQGGTLVVAGEAIGDNYMPAVGFQGWAGVWVLNNVFESLYTFRDFKTLIPALATSHTVSDDGLTYTFQLRKGVKFHDGTPFNAEAVEFNYMRYLDKNHPYYDPNAIYRTSMLPDVNTVKATDEYTVQIVRSKPMSAFVAALSATYAGIMSPTAIKKFGVQDVPRNPVGTGPFVFEKAEKGVQASFKAFDEYWNGRPPLDRVVVRVITDDQAMTASLLSGEVDMTPFIDFKDLNSFRNNPKLNVQVVPAASTGYIGINQAHETMKDVRVRQAMAHAVNKQKLIDVVFYGEADLGAGLVSMPMWAYAPQFKDYYKYDPQKAKDLLKEAGGAPDFTLHTQSSGFWPRMAELMQADFNDIGWKATIEKIDSAKFYGQMTEGTHQMFIGDGTYNTPDPDELFFVFYGCDNPRSKRWGYCNPGFEDLRAKESAEKDQEKRKQMMWDLQKQLLDDVTQIVNYYNRFATVSNKRVEGYNPLPIRYMFLDTVSVAK
jgi:peptide/nickel transport system substrate-binding protein